MKKVFLMAGIASLLLFTSCGEQSQSNGSGYTIETTINGIPDGVRAFLRVPNDKGQPVPKDTAIVQGGKFIFTGKTEFPQMGFVYVNGAPGNYTLILENSDIKVEAYKDSLPKAKVSGGKHNKEYVNFIEDSKILSGKMQKARERYAVLVKAKDTASVAMVRKQLSDLEKEAIGYQEQYVIEHPDSYISVLLVNRMLQNKLTTAPKAKVFYDGLPSDMKKTKVAEDLFIKITELLRAAVGSVATNFTAPNPEGKNISLNDIKGKVTVIDFWAAWCRPCRIENPNVVNIYNKYHADGLEIIGVSLDGRPNQKNAKEDWIRAIEQDGLPWHQVSNLAGFRDGIARTYNIRSIPATFILDETGTIVAKNLRGAQLEAKIVELLGK
ncbi:Thiol-disulfide oxidoreductase ResA [Kordia antarctica]|uniref:Thiol-disulfide oxidoreductase ResA n=1 Tax=Kordia antarctica TaxID=1218801 RepID=A0A7L4ZE78_9FLAO|nr:TlpA disulfide reductase family protein [Kordia antarctica]QHI34955.1 Thiol-disulfide oxidoreductase ResA [Kordia antarctica]